MTATVTSDADKTTTSSAPTKVGISAENAWRQSQRVVDVEAAIKHIRQVTVPRPDTDQEAVEAAAYAAIMRGDDPLPELEPLALVKHRAAAFERTHLVLRSIADRLTSEREQARANASGDALTWLNQRLTEDVVTPLTRVARNLRGVTNADNAIRAGAKTAAAWADLVGLTDQYHAIRVAQTKVAVHHEKNLSIGRYANVTQLLQRYGVIRDGGFTLATESHGGVMVTQRPGLPVVPGWPEGDGPDMLLWSAANPDTPLWVPTIPQLIDAADQHAHAEALRRSAEVDEVRRGTPYSDPTKMAREMVHQQVRAGVKADYENRNPGRTY